MNIQEFRDNARIFGWRAALRFIVAHLLDSSSRTCWAELVCWSTGSTRANIWQGRECRKDVHARLGGCYCGKFRREER